MPSPETLFDLDQLVPSEEWFRIRGEEIGIAPVFSVADQARYLRIQERLAYEQQYAADTQRRLDAWMAARATAEREDTTPPEPPAVLDRDPAYPLYDNESFERDVLDLLCRVWQASDAARLAEERVNPTPALVRETFTARQAWVAVQRLWPRRYGQRTAAPAPAPSAPTPVQPAPKPPRSRR